jgi:hypothetical protein
MLNVVRAECRYTKCYNVKHSLVCPRSNVTTHLCRKIQSNIRWVYVIVNYDSKMFTTFASGGVNTTIMFHSSFYNCKYFLHRCRGGFKLDNFGFRLML